MANSERTYKDPRYKQFSDSVERSLKLFEDAVEWQDIITCLTKLHKVLLSYPQFSVTPHKLSVYKRLSQCLLPGLPGGIHAKVLEVYITTFKRIGIDGVLADLSLISFGLFPLMSHASMQVRSLLLELYDGHLLPLGKELIPALEGIMLAVLPALEENKEHNLSSRVITFLNNLLEVTEAKAFDSAFWSILGRCSNCRLQCLLYWHAREGNRIHVGDDVSSTVTALVSCLADPSTLVMRLTLETVAMMFPFHSHHPLEFDQEVQLVVAALKILIHHDVSLLRRFSSWLDGSSSVVSKGSENIPPIHCHSSSQIATEEERGDTSYFRRHSNHYLKSAVTRLMPLNGSTTLDAGLPLKIVTILIQQCTFGKEIIDDLFADIILYALATSKLLLGQGKHNSFVIIAQQLLCGMNCHYVFAKVRELFSSVQHSDREDGINHVSLMFEVIQFLVGGITWEPSEELKAALETMSMDVFAYLRHSHQSLVVDEIVVGLSTCTSVLQKLEKIELVLSAQASSLVNQIEAVETSDDNLHGTSSHSEGSSTAPDGTLGKEGDPSVDNGPTSNTVNGEQGIAQVVEREAVMSLDKFQREIAMTATDLFVALLMVFPKDAVIGNFLQPLFSILMSPLIVPTFSALFYEAHCDDCPQWLTSLCTLCTESDRCNESALANSVLAIEVYCRCLETCERFMLCDCMHNSDGTISEKSNFILAFNEKTGFYKSILELLWDCLTPGTKMCTMAGVMIGRLHGLCCPHSPIEDLLLQQMHGVVPTFLELQKLVNLMDSTMEENVQHPFNRCALKCFTALSGTFGSQSKFIANWVVKALQRGLCAQLLHPVFCILLYSSRQLVYNEEGVSNLDQILMQLTGRLPGVPSPLIAVDPERLIYALAQFQAIGRVHPVLVVKSLAGCYIPVGNQGYTDKGEATKCTALERFVRECVVILVTTEAGVSFQENTQLTELNLACLEALGYLCDVFCNFPSGSHIDGLNLSADYFFSLLTLCEVQFTVLAVLQCWLQCAADCKFPLSMRACSQSLAVLHSIIVLENQVESVRCGSSAQSLSVDLVCAQRDTPSLLPGSAVVHQPLLWSMILQLITAQHDQARLVPISGYFLLSLMDCMKGVGELLLPYFLSKLSDVLSLVRKTKKGDMALSGMDSIDRHRLTLLTTVPGFLQGGLFKEFGMDSFEDFETGIFNEPPLIEWKRRLALLKKESQTSPRDSPEVQQLPAGKLKSVLWSFLGKTQQSAPSSREAAVKSDTDGHRAILDVVPKVLEAVINVWALSCSKASNNAVLADTEGAKIQGTAASCQHAESELQRRIKDTIRRVLAVLVKDDHFLIATLLSVWVNWVQPSHGDYRTVLIDMLHQTGVAPLDTLLTCIHEAVAAYGQLDNDASVLREEYLLHFTYRYLSSTHLRSEDLLAHHDILTHFVREIHKSTNHYGSLCLLTSIMHVVVCRCPSQMPKKELQVLSGTLCESLSRIAGISADSGFVWIQRNNITAVLQPLAADPTIDSGHTCKEDLQSKIVTLEPEKLQKPAIQALSVLSNVLPHFIDLLYPSEEKDTAALLLKSVWVNIRPHLVNHSSLTSICHQLTIKLIAGVSGFECTCAVWKKDVFDHFLNDSFFTMNESLLERWLKIIDDMVTQDRSTFRRLLGYIPGAKASLSGVAHFFSSSEQNYADYGRISRRVAFVLLAGEVDQYNAELPEIRMLLFEGLKQFQTPDIAMSAYLLLRVILVRTSSNHLEFLWPTIMTELMAGIGRLAADFALEAKGATTAQNQLNLHLALCKLLEHMLSISATQLPQFQFTRWAFCDFHSCSAWDDLSPFLQQNLQRSTPCSVLRIKYITSLDELVPFLSSLMTSNMSPRDDSAAGITSLRLEFLL